MKKLTIYLLCAVLLLTLPFSVAAFSEKIVDDANLLSDSEEVALEQKAKTLVSKYQMDVVILTVWSLDGKSAQDYADDYYDTNGYGIGGDYSGLLLLLSMENRDWYISTCGETIYALTDYGIQSVFEEIAWYLSEDQYYYAFDEYLDQLDDYFAAYAQGEPVDGYKDPYDGPGSYYPGTYDDIVYYDDSEQGFVIPLFISLAIGAAVGGIAILIMRSQMNTAVAQSGAQSYVQNGSYHLNQQQDVFLYQNITRIRRAESSSGSRGGSFHGGGSRIHTSSFGRRHGGGGGRF